MKRILVFSLVFALLAALLFGCQNQEKPIVQEEPAVTVSVAGSWPDLRAIDVLAKAFKQKYPNCDVVYEYVQDYYASLEKRLAGDDPFDLFFTTNIQEGFSMLPFAQDLYSCEGLDFSKAFDGLIQNFVFKEEAGAKPKLYAVPVGAEMRGLYINVTLLNSVGLEIPTNQESLLAACETLKQKGYIAFHGNPGNFAQMLLYPWICNLVANAEDSAAAYASVNKPSAGVSEMFREPYEFLYTLVENGYYDYKTAQTDWNLFTDMSDEACARDFLNIQGSDDSWAKADDIGRVAFMPASMSLGNTIAKTKDDYHSNIEYVFVPAPIGPDGGFVYLSPAHGIAICKNTKQLEWAVKLLDFLFVPENNQAFTQAFNVVPNTMEAFSYITTRFDVPDKRISHLGQVTFDYDFYNIVRPSMTDLSKANNPKYMKDDGSGNLSLYPLDTYMDSLEASLLGQ